MPFRDGTPTLLEMEEKRRKEEAEQRKIRESTPRLVFSTYFPEPKN